MNYARLDVSACSWRLGTYIILSWMWHHIVWLLQIIGSMLLDYVVSHARKTVIFMVAVNLTCKIYMVFP